MIGMAAGALSGLLGIGGGILMVPAFSTLVGLPLKDTIALAIRNKTAAQASNDPVVPNPARYARVARTQVIY